MKRKKSKLWYKSIWLTCSVFILILGFSSCTEKFEYEYTTVTPPDSTETILDFLKSNPTMTIMVRAIEHAELQSMFNGSYPDEITLFALNDNAWTVDILRSNATVPKYRGKQVEDIDKTVLANFIKGMVVNNKYVTYRLPLPFDEMVQTLDPNTALRVRVENNGRYFMNLNAGQNSFAGNGGRNNYWSNHLKVKSVVHAFDRLYLPIQ